MRIVLVSCVSRKKVESAKAKELYISTWFKYAMQFANRMNADKVFILSAKYGLIEPEDIIAPYERTLNNMNKQLRAEWSQNVFRKLSLLTETKNDFYFFFAGAKYREFLFDRLENKSAPLSSMGIGKQLSFFKKESKNAEVICTCEELHSMCNGAYRFFSPFFKQNIPQNGIYIMFEKGEKGHHTDRIVRVGTHNGDNQLPSRIKQHFIMENKNRSIFRKNIGRAMLKEQDDPYINIWELDSTSKRDREANKDKVDQKYEQEIEKKITKHIQNNVSFVIIEEDDKRKRLELESKIASTVSRCTVCSPSKTWLGLQSPKGKIRGSGLWQVNELYKNILTKEDLSYIKNRLVRE